MTEKQDLQALYDQLTESYQPLWAAQEEVHNRAVALARAVVLKHFPDATTLVLDWSDQTPDRCVPLDVLTDDDSSPDLDTIPGDDFELLEHAVSDLDGSRLGKRPALNLEG